MNLARTGPFETHSYASGIATAAALLLIMAFFIGGPLEHPDWGFHLGISGLVLGCVAAAVFVAATIKTDQ
jgi:hypothetical protein